jgi:hypothetical protein
MLMPFSWSTSPAAALCRGLMLKSAHFTCRRQALQLFQCMLVPCS